MAVISKIKLSVIKELVKRISEMSLDIKSSQKKEKYIESRIEENENIFSKGMISRSFYDKNKLIWENERERISSNIKNDMEKIQEIIKSAQIVIKANKI